MNYLLTFNVNWADEHNVPALACMSEEEYANWCNSLNLRCSENQDSEERGIIPTAHLGNGGDDFDKQFNNCYSGQDFINKGHVKVTVVDDEFVKSFKYAKLDRLSLSPLFNLEVD